MRRITMWITATVAVLAMTLAYQANVSGATGKAGDNPASASVDGAGTDAKAGESK